MYTCSKCTTQFEITESDREFYRKVVPTFNEKHFAIPDPDLCPICRKKLRLAWRNLRNVYYRTCDFTGEKIMSCYDTDSPHKVYRGDIWWSDKWDPLEYERDYDFNRPFFEQWHELLLDVPVLDRYALLNENCDFINGAAKCKNCYLSFNMDYCEDGLYIGEAKHTVSCVDSLSLVNCELCYECVDTERCYNLKYSERCVSCSDSYFLMDCRQCKNCIGCVNLVGKENYIFNKKSTPEEVQRYKDAFKSRKYVEGFSEKFAAVSLQYPRKYYFGHTNENFSGNMIHHVKNSYECYDTFELENCSYCYYVFRANNCRDYDIFGDNSEWIYNCVATGVNCSYNICCNGVWNASSNNIYCFLMGGSSNNFGCSGLKHKQYCILNKQYSKEEYEKLVPKIIEHMQKEGSWGRYFPREKSPYGYNETMAHQFFPLSKEQAIAEGFTWKEHTDAGPKIDGIHIKQNVPDTIAQVTEDMVKGKVFTCSESGKPFKVIPQEFAFYKKNNIPLPAFHPEVRFTHRAARRNPPRLWERICAKCSAEIQTTYAPEQPEIVYCEKCYLEAVY